VNTAESVTRRLCRRAAWGGVVGPVSFLGAWVVGGAVTTAHYSPVHDPISRLAAIGTDTRGLMSAGFVGFGLGVPLYAAALRLAVPGRAWMGAVATGLATLGVAAAPLGRSATGDTWHGVFALAGYISLASTPLLAAPSLVRTGQRTLASLGVASCGVTALALVLATTTTQRGLFQRIGLTSTHLWIVASALTVLGSAGDPSST
jgi:Protein of unknown function (DUF998)